MPTTKLSSRELNQDTARAKRASRSGPVIITQRGRPAHVLMTYRDYTRLVGAKGSIIEWLGGPAGVEDIELEVSPARELVRPAEIG
jgi:prevent-host-death family protein